MQKIYHLLLSDNTDVVTTYEEGLPTAHFSVFNTYVKVKLVLEVLDQAENVQCYQLQTGRTILYLSFI